MALGPVSSSDSQKLPRVKSGLGRGPSTPHARHLLVPPSCTPEPSAPQKPPLGCAWPVGHSPPLPPSQQPAEHLGLGSRWWEAQPSAGGIYGNTCLDQARPLHLPATGSQGSEPGELEEPRGGLHQHLGPT